MHRDDPRRLSLLFIELRADSLGSNAQERPLKHFMESCCGLLQSAASV
jgi:hypothetical protein